MDNADSTGPIHPLNYAPPDNRRRWWRIVRRTVFWTLVLAVGIAGFTFRTELWLRTGRAYWLYECMHHITPPGTVLVETDPAKAADLLANNPDYVRDGTQTPTGTFPHQATATTAGYWPRALRQYVRLAPPYPIFDTEAIVFMDERISPAGNRRLVVIPYAAVYPWEFESHPGNLSWVIEPTSFLGSGPANWVDTSVGIAISTTSYPVSLKPGVADQKDLSHFTIDYFDLHQTANNGTFDIHLKDDDTLSVKIIMAH